MGFIWGDENQPPLSDFAVAKPYRFCSAVFGRLASRAEASILAPSQSEAEHYKQRVKGLEKAGIHNHSRDYSKGTRKRACPTSFDLV
jgi:hypothetical protein